MELRYACPRCGAENRMAGAEESSVLSCSECGYAGLLPLDWAGDGRVVRCPICGGERLYRQKDFHQKLGIGIVIAGVALALPTRYLSLVASAILVLVLYVTAPEVLTCYRCRTRVRGHLPSDEHGRFDARLEERCRRERERGADRQDSRRGPR